MNENWKEQADWSEPNYVIAYKQQVREDVVARTRKELGHATVYPKKLKRAEPDWEEVDFEEDDYTLAIKLQLPVYVVKKARTAKGVRKRSPKKNFYTKVKTTANGVEASGLFTSPEAAEKSKEESEVIKEARLFTKEDIEKIIAESELPVLLHNVLEQARKEQQYACFPSPMSKEGLLKELVALVNRKMDFSNTVVLL